MTSYILLLRLEEPAVIKIGSLGRLRFQSGYYAYVGSAKRNPDSRLMRHMQRSKKKRWHIDYLREKTDVRRIYLSTQAECNLNEMINKRSGREIIYTGFGSSDCECDSHLSYFREEPDLSTIGLIDCTGFEGKCSLLATPLVGQQYSII